MPDLDVRLWSGLFAPIATPAAIVKKLEKELIEIIKLPDVRERLVGLSVDPAGDTGAGLRAHDRAGARPLGDDRQGRQHQARLDGQGTASQRGSPPPSWPQPPPTCCWRRCRRHGIEYFFANPGTDFPPIVEGFARAKASGAKVPRAGAGAAREPRRRHGARRLPDDRGAAGADGARQRRHRQHHQPAGQCSARPRAAAADGGALAHHGGGRRSGRAAGRSTGRRRCSTRPAWCASSSSGTTSCAIPRRPARSSRARWKRRWPPPRGPVYLMLPREPLSAPAGTDKATEPRSAAVRSRIPIQPSIDRLADWLMEAERPLLIASSVGRVPEEAQALAQARRALRRCPSSPTRRAMSVPGERSSHAPRLRSRSLPR